MSVQENKPNDHEHISRIVGTADMIGDGVKFDIECTVKGCNKTGWKIFYCEPEDEWHD